MKEIDSGHKYLINNYDVDNKNCQFMYFMKREGKNYPCNNGHHQGTNCQEVLRILIARVIYLNKQIPSIYNSIILLCFRIALYVFELRAAKKHKRKLYHIKISKIEQYITCDICGHISCGMSCSKD